VAQATTLSNGLRVVSSDSGNGVASIALTFKAGSRFDVVPGTSHVAESLAFAATQHRSALKLHRDAEEIGATLKATGSREALAWTGEILRDGTDALTALLAEAATQPALKRWEVSEVAESLSASAATGAGPVATVLDGLHAAAFGAESPLGRSRVASPADYAAIDAGVLRAFLGDRVSSALGVLTAVNVDHADLVAAAEKHLLGNLGAGAPTAATTSPASVHIGGEAFTRVVGGGTAHFGIALAAPAGGSKAAPALAVLRALLGSTGAHGGAAGRVRLGPQSHARIPRSVHTEAHSFIASLGALAPTYSDAGLLCLVGSCADHETGRLAHTMVGLVKDAAAVGATPAELARAKKSVALNFMRGIESRAGGVSDAAAQYLVLPAPRDAAAVLAAIEAVSAADVQAVAAAALKSAPAFAAVGTLSTIPRYDVLASLLK